MGEEARVTSIQNKLNTLFLGLEAEGVSATVPQAIIAIIGSNKASIEGGLIKLNNSIPDTGGRSYLHCAVNARQQEIVRLLLNHGADPNKQDEHGYSPLHEAAQRIDQISGKAIVGMLLDGGGDKHLANYVQGETPVDMVPNQRFKKFINDWQPSKQRLQSVPLAQRSGGIAAALAQSKIAAQEADPSSMGAVLTKIGGAALAQKLGLKVPGLDTGKSSAPSKQDVLDHILKRKQEKAEAVKADKLEARARAEAALAAVEAKQKELRAQDGDTSSVLTSGVALSDGVDEDDVRKRVEELKKKKAEQMEARKAEKEKQALDDKLEILAMLKRNRSKRKPKAEVTETNVFDEVEFTDKDSIEIPAGGNYAAMKQLLGQDFHVVLSDPAKVMERKLAAAKKEYDKRMLQEKVNAALKGQVFNPTPFEETAEAIAILGGVEMAKKRNAKVDPKVEMANLFDDIDPYQTGVIDQDQVHALHQSLHANCTMPFWVVSDVYSALPNHLCDFDHFVDTLGKVHVMCEKYQSLLWDFQFLDVGGVGMLSLSESDFLYNVNASDSAIISYHDFISARGSEGDSPFKNDVEFQAFRTNLLQSALPEYAPLAMTSFLRKT